MVLLLSTCTWNLFQIGRHLLRPDPASVINNPNPNPVCNLGIWLDSDCSMTTHINKTTHSCYASLRKMRSIAAPHSLDVRKPAIQLVGLHASRLEQLQHVDIAVKIINNKRKHDHVTPLLHDLHWLCICQRIEYKISSLVFKFLLGHAPSYLPFSRTAQIPARCGLRSATKGSLVKSMCDTGWQIYRSCWPTDLEDSPFDYQHWSSRISLCPQNLPLQRKLPSTLVVLKFCWSYAILIKLYRYRSFVKLITSVFKSQAQPRCTNQSTSTNLEDEYQWFFFLDI